MAVPSAVGKSVPKTESGLAPPGRGVERARDEVRFRAMVFADVAGCAGDVEIAQRGVGEAIRLRIGGDGALGGELRGAVGIDRLERRVLGDRNLLGSAVDRGSRREDDGRHAGVAHGVQDIERAAGVDPPVGRGIAHRLRRDGQSREMEDRIGVVLTSAEVTCRAIADVDPYQRYAARQRLPVALGQVVDGDNIVAARDQARDGGAADVSGASGDDDSHIASCHSRAWAGSVPDCRIGQDRPRSPLDGPIASLSKKGATDARPVESVASRHRSRGGWGDRA